MFLLRALSYHSVTQLFSRLVPKTAVSGKPFENALATREPYYWLVIFQTHPCTRVYGLLCHTLLAKIHQGGNQKFTARNPR